MADNPNVSGDVDTLQKQLTTNQKSLDVLGGILKKLEEIERDGKRGNAFSSAPSMAYPKQTQEKLQQTLLAPTIPTKVEADKQPTKPGEEKKGTVREQANAKTRVVQDRLSKAVPPVPTGQGPPPLPSYKTPPPLPGQKGQGPPPLPSYRTPPPLPVGKQGVPSAGAGKANLPTPIKGTPEKTGSQKAGEAAGVAMDAARAAEGDPVAMAKLAKKAKEKSKEAQKRMMEALKGMGQAGMNAAGSERAGDIGASGFQFTGQAGKFIGGPAGEVIKKVSKFGEEIFKSFEKLRGWNDQLHNANMRFAEFSASMAVVQARQEVRDIELSRKRGDRRAAVAESVAQSRHALNEAVAPFEDFWANMMGGLSSVISGTLAVPIKELAKKLGLEKSDADAPEYLGKSLWDLTENNSLAEKYERPERFM